MLDENGKAFEDNEAEIIEPGEALIWEVEPMPENYHRYVMYF